MPHHRALALAVTLLLPTAALAGPPAKSAGARASLDHGVKPRSIGSPTTGHLIGGSHLDEGPHLRVVPAYAQGDVRWGLPQLVGMVNRAGRAVRRQYPDAVLSVGHLSRKGGGEIDHHASHESGRDVDIGFYVRNGAGKPVLESRFIAFAADGAAPSMPGAHFDDARNWALVTALVSDPSARVTHVFVAAPLRARLLAHADRVAAPQALRARAAELMAQPRGALPHDDHFHVRIGCPSGMDRCIEQPQIAHHQASITRSRPAARPAPPAHPTSPAAPGKPKVGSRAGDAEPAPRLAPVVDGLDSALVVTPIGPVLDSTPKATPPAPLDDVDGTVGPSHSD